MARDRKKSGTWLTFSEPHKGHVDGNRHVKGKLDKGYGKSGGHHQTQSRGYDGTSASVPVRRKKDWK